VTDFTIDRNNFRKLFINNTSRMLLGIWYMARGSRFPFASIMELLSLTEDALEGKLQSFAGLGLAHLHSMSQGEREIEFLASASPEIDRQVAEFFAGRQNDFQAIELKVNSLLYKTLLSSKL
jgi:hypothetical protein